MLIFSVVFQDFNLFAVTLGQNISASLDYDRDKVKKCLDEVGMGKRFAEMPDGVDTYIYKNFDDSGVEISGGEARRLPWRVYYKKTHPLLCSMNQPPHSTLSQNLKSIQNSMKSPVIKRRSISATAFLPVVSVTKSPYSTKGILSSKAATANL